MYYPKMLCQVCIRTHSSGWSHIPLRVTSSKRVCAKRRDNITALYDTERHRQKPAAMNRILIFQKSKLLFYGNQTKLIYLPLSITPNLLIWISKRHFPESQEQSRATSRDVPTFTKTLQGSSVLFYFSYFCLMVRNSENRQFSDFPETFPGDFRANFSWLRFESILNLRLNESSFRWRSSHTLKAF